MKYLFVLLAVLSLQVQAQVFQGPVSRGMGGAGRAGLDATEGVFLNPALVAVIPKSEFVAYYRDGYLDPGRHSQAVGLSASENGEEVMVPGALSYLRLRDTGTYRIPVNGEIWHGALGKMWYERFALGASVYRLVSEPKDERELTQWNGSLGAVFLITPYLGVGYVLNNPAKPGSEVPASLRQVTEQGIGLYYSSPWNARFRIDATRKEKYNPEQKWNLHTGIDVLLKEFLIFRTGAEWNELERRTLATAGLTFNGPKFQIDYSVEKNTRRIGGALHSVDLRMSF